MAQMEGVSFGNELKDGFKIVDTWVNNGVTWLLEIQEFYRERAAIEKEYSMKLMQLAKKYYDKKAKRSSNISVGDTPALTPGSLESASLTTWTTQLTTLEHRANEHQRLGDDFTKYVADPLVHTQSRLEELRKHHSDYEAKLVRERDLSYSDLKKLKTKYDAVCQEVEKARKKTDSSFGGNKAAATYNQQLIEMHNIKNTYLIAINVTNKLKECYYHAYVPELLDSLQDLSETRTTGLNKIWLLASALETQSLKRSEEHMNHLTAEIPRNNPILDSIMFVRHNAVHWQEPPHFVFEPSPVWLDTDGMATTDTAKIFLRNILAKDKPLLNGLKSESTTKQRELSNVKQARANIRAGKDKRNEVDCVKSQFAVMEELHDIERRKMTAEVEISTVTGVVGDLSIYGKSHQFKSETFKIPTNCDFCGDRIWGLSAKGFICTDCGYTCHSKCQMKVPPDCPGEQSKEDKKKLKIERQAAAGAQLEVISPPNGASQERLPLSRQDTMNSLSSGYSQTATRSISQVVRGGPTELDANSSRTSLPSTNIAPSTSTGGARRNRIVAPPPTSYVSASADGSPGGGGQKKGKMIYAYEARDAGEVSVAEGRDVTILEPDDGGWTKVRLTTGKEGVVPTAYLEELTSPFLGEPQRPSMLDRPPSAYSNSDASFASSHLAAKKRGPAVAPKRGARKVKYAEAMYAYTAQSDAEHDIEEGERFILISMGTGDGWAEVEKNGETRSVPANYIKEV